jgi:hypothetical protein
MEEQGVNFSFFKELSFDKFKKMASDSSLSRYEKIGFPDEYRLGKEPLIYEDILRKLPRLFENSINVLDIGPGCSDLPRMFIDNAKNRDQRIIMVDSEEMLSLLPDCDHLTKIAAMYPDCPGLFERYTGAIDVIIVYSVLQYIFAELSVFDFLDKTLSLLSNGGAVLLGDIPNISKRKRFFSSETGLKFHEKFMGDKNYPELKYNILEEKQIDDSVVFALLMRARAQGFDSYILPQGIDLPMSNRREDILITRA